MYGTHDPLDVTTLYNLLDFRIDFIAGGSDSIVSPRAVQKHVKAVTKANEQRILAGDAPIAWTYKILPKQGHLDIIDGENEVAVQCLRECWQITVST